MMEGQVFQNTEAIGLGSPATEGFFVSWASPAMRAIESMLADIGNSGVPVLLTGERGVGKKAIALRIHQLSPRHKWPVLRVRSSSLSSEELGALLLEDGSLGRKTADPATLILDEVSELSPACQTWLVRNAWPGNGSTDGSQTRLRLICTTCFNLDEENRAGRFADELYYRMSGVCLHLPPLRHRREDIPLLAEFFVAKYAELFAQPIPSLSADAMCLITERDWPGNIREMEAVIRRVVAAGDEKALLGALDTAPAARSRPGNGEARSLKQVAKEASRQAERALILKVLTETRWNRKRAAQKLQISYKALLYKLKQTGLDDSAS
jgi:two-component system response regulator AtoC